MFAARLARSLRPPTRALAAPRRRAVSSSLRRPVVTPVTGPSSDTDSTSASNALALPSHSSIRPNTSSPSSNPVLQARDLLPTNPAEGLRVAHKEDNGGLGNSVWNPRARPMLPDVMALHDRDYGHMSGFLGEHGGVAPEELHDETERQLSTAEIGSVKPPSRLGPHEMMIGAHHSDQETPGRYAVRPENASADLVNDVALAWDQGHGDEQHTMRSAYVGHGEGAPIIESVAAAKNHRTDGRLLPGGMQQFFMPQGLWEAEGGGHADKGLRKLGTSHKDELLR